MGHDISTTPTSRRRSVGTGVPRVSNRSLWLCRQSGSALLTILPTLSPTTSYPRGLRRTPPVSSEDTVHWDNKSGPLLNPKLQVQVPPRRSLGKNKPFEGPGLDPPQPPYSTLFSVLYTVLPTGTVLRRGPPNRLSVYHLPPFYPPSSLRDRSQDHRPNDATPWPPVDL